MIAKTYATALMSAVLFVSTGCQQRSFTAAIPTVATQSVTTQVNQPVLSAKFALEKAEQYALEWSPEATLTHVFGQYITQQGLPHKTRGSWTFSFINYDAPNKGFQVHMQSGRAYQRNAMPASRLARREPLEIRAWNLDSNHLIPRVKALFPGTSTPLADLELTSADRRLVWSLGKNKLIDAMNGRIFTP